MKKSFASIIILCSLLFVPFDISMGQDTKGILEKYSKPKQVEEKVTDSDKELIKFADKNYHELKITQENHKLYLILALIVAQVVTLLIVLKYITRASYTASHIVNASGLVFIIFGTLFLVLLADVDQQLSAAIGILGAVAGYLFGAMKKGEDGEEAAKEKEIK